MREGLVLLNEQGYILSMNPAARNIFAVEGDCAGKDFLTVDRSCDMSAAVRSAMESGHGRLHERHEVVHRQVDVSRIDSDGTAIGTVILVFDVTEQESAEQMRREFTANVSHELKTPLQGIIGSAELIENGMVQPEDMPRFVGHIRAEARDL
ncbi:MAG: histidine kinase dimerization/phospho-acceptor domain-containing protein [Oscillospiraceae bacterium]